MKHILYLLSIQSGLSHSSFKPSELLNDYKKIEITFSADIIDVNNWDIHMLLLKIKTQ